MEEKDKVISDVINNDNQSGDKQSDEVKEETTLESVATLVKALQKGYTETRQEFAKTKEDLENIVTAINSKTGAETGDDEYLTVGKLKTILAEQSSIQEQRKSQADTYIESTLNQLKAEGRISGKEEEDALLNFALKHKETDLMKAADLYDEVKEARKEAIKEGAKKVAKQEEGSKIGTSQKAGTSEQGGVDYRKVKNMDWFSF